MLFLRVTQHEHKDEENEEVITENYYEGTLYKALSDISHRLVKDARNCIDDDHYISVILMKEPRS